jgi:hypothetical protein
MGVPAMVGGFFYGEYHWVAAGGTCVAVGAWLFTANVIVTFVRSSRRDAIGWSLPLAAGWLTLTVFAGMTMAASRLGVLLPLSPPALLRAHAHAGIAGFFLTLIQGVAFQLVPMFTLGEVGRPWRISAGLAGSQAGLATLIVGLAVENAAATWIGAALLVSGVILSGIELAETLRNRRKRKLEPGINAFVAGAAMVGAGAIGGVLLLWSEPEASLRATFAYGVIVVAGALALMVMGMLCKIIPFLVWMRAYGPKVGRAAVPAAHTLGHSTWERAWLGLHSAGAVTLATGACAGSLLTVSAGAGLLATGVIFFVLNAVRVLGHLRATAPAPLFAAQPRHS